MYQRVEKPARGAILLSAPSGFGKSSIIADLAQQLETQSHSLQWHVFDHYFGADKINTLNGWLQRLYETLHPQIADLTGPIPTSPAQQWQQLSTWLSHAARRLEQKAGADRPVRFALLLDGLDQLVDGGRNLSPFTAALSADAVLVVSAAENTPAHDAARKFTGIAVPALDDASKATLVRQTLRRYSKALPEAGIRKLSDAAQTGNPLYLTLALEKLRLDARHASLDTLLDSVLASPDASHLFLHQFLLDPAYNRPEQPTLAADFMALLGAARNGLGESEIAGLLALPADPVDASTGKPRLPQIYLSRLINTFQAVLLSKQGNRASMHRMLDAAVLAHAGEAAIRRRLYAYFSPAYDTAMRDAQLRAANEALTQISWLARIPGADQAAARERLRQDLGFLPLPLGLYQEEWATLRAAIDTLGDEINAVLECWQNTIDAFSTEELLAKKTSISGLASLLGVFAVDHHRPARALLESLLKRLEAAADAAADAADTGAALERERVDALDQLGMVCHRQQDFAGERRYLERAFAISEGIAELESDVAHRYNNLAECLIASNDPDDFIAARALYEKALSAIEATHGPHDKAVGDVCCNVGKYLRETDKPADRTRARELLLRAHRIHTNATEPDWLSIASANINLALCLEDSGNIEEFGLCRGLFEQSLRIRETIFGPWHPDVADSCNYLATYLKKTQRRADFVQARALFERVLEIREAALPEQHMDTGEACYQLAQYLHASANPFERGNANRLFERALAIFIANGETGARRAHEMRQLITLNRMKPRTSPRKGRRK
ncbi:tetratricopeptide repeat protein [Paraburkholderia sp. MMS20-SJTR3]|uniref:Tetratricopeptide repeat protein n=2 Tax=Paraburkholderia sejongensis TaxID=2886946 RepID=A0ABS8K0Z4_9BURK|nr:tetratricopeptide repeat protein [Paraburkholderia sp. MMS20-SJTR3]MCC8395832.1 tetratricopeptide repeat protein [Paraburkholderia sp. MMS20-SJTR3]